MRKGRDGEKNGKKTGGKKEKTDDYSGHYVIASSRPPERRPLECRPLVPILRSQDDGDKKAKEQNQQDCDQKQNVLLSAIKERFSENLEEIKHSILFLSVIQENGMEVSDVHNECQ